MLAKVNVDDNPGLSSALNIQSIPMVLGFRDGQIVAEFVGAVPEAAARAFLAKLLPSEADQLAVTAEQSLAAGKVEDAETGFRRALELDANCGAALVGLANVLAKREAYSEAMALLDRVAPGPARQHADRLAAEIRIRQGGGGDESSLRAKIAANPGDLETRLLLAQLLAAASRYEEALRENLEVVRRDRSFRDGTARKAMLDIFDLLGPENELTRTYRSELAKLLFS